MGYLNNAGLSYFWGKLKEKFAPKNHTHDDRYYTESEMDGKLNSKVNNNEAGANGLLSKLAVWTATPGDDTYFMRQNVEGTNTFGRVKFFTIWSYIKGKADVVYQPKGSYAAASHTHTKSQITDFPALGTAAAKNVRTLTAQGASGWKDVATDQQYVPDMAFMAYWNGAYSGTSSNLTYCNRGAFGTIVTKSTSDYAVAGHTHTWDSVTGKPSTFTPSSHTHGVIKSLSVSGTTITYTKDDNTTGTITTQDTNTTYGTFKGATTSEAGSTGLVIAPVAGNANRYLRSDGTWAVPPDTNTTYGVFAKATADAAGSTGLVPAPAKGQQTYYLRGDGTWAVPANTWRGIQDNLTSTSTTDSLSANQGKVLKGLIDGKAASGHTHNYAGSSSAGGAATSANKVNAALTINLNGTSQGAWDGSSAKSISITAASVGATSVTISRW